MVGFLLSVQLLLETAPQPAVARALQVKEFAMARVLQVGIVQSSLGMALGTTHIHLTHLAGVRGWAENQILWCNAHYI